MGTKEDVNLGYIIQCLTHNIYLVNDSHFVSALDCFEKLNLSEWGFSKNMTEVPKVKPKMFWATWDDYLGGLNSPWLGNVWHAHWQSIWVINAELRERSPWGRAGGWAGQGQEQTRGLMVLGICYWQVCVLLIRITQILLNKSNATQYIFLRN